ncbi:hypothetical protein [Pseudarthrobacter sp. S9]|uniref:hypothetical protein n=1 Tax=Pseudarthrobacter sp. S9 TaxID=3418421 RepID=UPI003D08132F
MPSRRIPAAALSALVAAVIGLAACSVPAGPGVPPSSSAAEANQGGDIPDNQAFVSAKGVSGDFEVQIPEGWAETRTGTSKGFTDKLNSVTMVQSPAPVAPTVQSVTSQDVPDLQKSVPSFVLKDVSVFTRSGGSGVLIRYSGDSAPDPVTHKSVRQAIERYAFWSNGRMAALTLASPDGTDNADPWAKISGSFRWLR